MAYYNSLQSLGNNILQDNDIVEIAGIRYKVLSYNLSCRQDGFINNEVFKRLGIPDKEKYCEIAYGYPPRKGDWPEYKFEDYGAATRVVANLFKTWELQKGAIGQSSLIVNNTKEYQKSNTKLLPAKCNSIKQITIQKEITFNKL